jgi:hypothetical protein
MEKQTILLFSILISFNSYGEWLKVHKNTSGNTSYIGTDTIKERGGYVYWWRLTDYPEPNEYGDMSSNIHYQGDCGVNRFKYLSFIFYKQPMGRGSKEKGFNAPGWNNPTSKSVDAILLNYACNYVK